MKRLALVALVLLAGSGCPGSGQPEKDLGQGVGDAASDTRVLSEAQDAVNRVIRAGADCEVVGATLTQARDAVVAASAAIRTPTGRVTLEALERSLERAAQACP